MTHTEFRIMSIIACGSSMEIVKIDMELHGIETMLNIASNTKPNNQLAKRSPHCAVVAPAAAAVAVAFPSLVPRSDINA